MYLAAIFSKHYNIPHTRRKNKGGGLSVKDEQTSTNPQKLVLASPLPLKKKKNANSFLYTISSFHELVNSQATVLMLLLNHQKGRKAE